MQKITKELCLECVLPICDEDRNKPCRFLTITIDEHLADKMETLRRQKREHNARVREMRRAEAAALRKAVERLLAAYGTFGKYKKLVQQIRLEAKI